MADAAETLQNLVSDLRIGISLCTRLPLAPTTPLDDGDVARASWSFPIAGLLVGLAGAFAYWLASRLHIACALPARSRASSYIAPLAWR